MWIAFMRKFSQVRRPRVLSLLEVVFVEGPASEPLIVTLLHVFSEGLIFFLAFFFFFPFFPWLSVIRSSLASYAVSKLALKTNPRRFQGVVSMGISRRKAAWPIAAGAGLQGEKDQYLKPSCQWSTSCWASSAALLHPMAQPFPAAWFTERHKRPFFSQWNWSWVFLMVWKWLKLLCQIFETSPPCTRRLWVFARVCSLALAAWFPSFLPWFCRWRSAACPPALHSW